MFEFGALLLMLVGAVAAVFVVAVVFMKLTIAVVLVPVKIVLGLTKIAFGLVSLPFAGLLGVFFLLAILAGVLLLPIVLALVLVSGGAYAGLRILT